jgi:uracil-DNA glycosylase family 4
LVSHCEAVAATKRRAYQHWDYWGKPVPSFGDPAARLLVIGLAPGAHGANRTGRMFTGDSSGDFLYSALFASGFASQPTSTGRGDGLRLTDAYITAPVRCAPPGNKPTRAEFAACRPFLRQELELAAQRPGCRCARAAGARLLPDFAARKRPRPQACRVPVRPR